MSDVIAHKTIRHHLLLLMKCDRLTLKLTEKIENADGTACAELLALRGQELDQNRPLHCMIYFLIQIQPK